MSNVLDKTMSLVCWKWVWVVYAATLAHSPGTQVELAITYLTDEQLEHMHKTEGSYNLMRLDNIALFLAESLSACRSAHLHHISSFVSTMAAKCSLQTYPCCSCLTFNTNIGSEVPSFIVGDPCHGGPQLVLHYQMYSVPVQTICGTVTTKECVSA